jgi:hypothetical protein
MFSLCPGLALFYKNASKVVRFWKVKAPGLMPTNHISLLNEAEFRDSVDTIPICDVENCDSVLITIYI